MATSTAASADRDQCRPLRVSIYPYIPDLAGDSLESLKGYIKARFKESTGIEVIINAQDPYDLQTMKTKHLSPQPDSYDIMEVDTLVLGELASSGCLKKYDKDRFNVASNYFDWCVRSVKFKEEIYGIPTLQCANFLIELASAGHLPENPLLKDWKSFSKLKATLDRQEESGRRILVEGDFRGSWGLPLLYLEAYVDEHGKKSLYEGIDAGVDPNHPDGEIIWNLKEFTDYGALESGKNPDTDGKFHENHKALIDEAVDSNHILMFCYSEVLGETLFVATSKKNPKIALKIASTPLDKCNFLITYTDALVVNKHTIADQGHIEKFMEFYTSLDVREAIAFGYDLPREIRLHLSARYILPARKDFFSTDKVMQDDYYQQFFEILHKHSIPAPNHDIVEKRISMQRALVELLGFKQGYTHSLSNNYYIPA